MHFFNPGAVMKLVEVIRGLADQRRQRSIRCMRFRAAIGKIPVEVNDACRGICVQPRA